MLINNARTELKAYALRLQSRAEDLGKESSDVLNAVNNFPQEPCSGADLAFMKGLVLETRFVRDVGRIRDNRFICTALLGVIRDPIPISAAPTSTNSSGSRVYRNKPYLLNSSPSSAVLYGSAGVFIDDGAFFDIAEFPMRYSIFSIDRKRGSADLLYGKTLGLSPADVLSQRDGTRQGALYSIVCSRRPESCQVTSVQIEELQQEHRNVLIALAVFGAFAGISFAAIVFLFVRRQRTLEKQLRRAISRDQLYLVYQPIVDLPGGRLVGAEALVRWKTTTGEQIAPDVFIPLAERGKFIGDITRLVIRRTISEMAPLLQQNPDFHVAINIAASDLTDPAVLQELSTSLARYNLPPSAISLELTERSTGDDTAVHEAISSLRKQGHNVLIDDFGTGYSSLAYLNKLDVDGMKIDRSFTATVGTEAVTAAIVPQILAMASALELNVVVEGIETETQVRYFSNSTRSLFGQGWYFSRPLSPEDLTRKVVAQTSNQQELDASPGPG